LIGRCFVAPVKATVISAATQKTTIADRMANIALKEEVRIAVSLFRSPDGWGIAQVIRNSLIERNRACLAAATRGMGRPPYDTAGASV
jgi:hypothetical protein